MFCREIYSEIEDSFDSAQSQIKQFSFEVKICDRASLYVCFFAFTKQ